jgi:hypothetical protein
MRAKQFTRPSEIVDEAKMNPGEFEKAIQSGHEAGVLVGYEFEVCIPYGTFGDGEEGEGAINRDWMAEFFVNHNYFTEITLGHISPAELDSVFTFKDEANPRFKTFTDATDAVLRERIEEVKQMFSALADDVRAELVTDAKNYLNKIDRSNEVRYTTNDDLHEEYMFARTLTRFAQHRNRELRAPDMGIELDDVFRAIFGMNSDTIDSDINHFFDYDPAKVFEELQLDDWADSDYDDNNSHYRAGAQFLADVLQHNFGTDVHIFDSYHEFNKNATDWYIEPDGSLRSNDDSDVALEIVSPPLAAKDAIAAITKFYSIARRYSLYTNDSTGLHINVSIPRTLDVLKLALFLGDAHVLQIFKRENNDYAVSIMNQLQRRLERGGGGVIKAGTKNDDGSVEQSSTIDLNMLKKVAEDISGGHTVSISNNGNYISFRHAGDDYLQNNKDVMDVIGRFVRSMIIASDPEAYKQDYLKKLYQLTAASGGHTKQLIASGDIALQSLQDIRTNGVPTITAYVYCPSGRVDIERLSKRIAQNYAGEFSISTVAASSKAQSVLGSRSKSVGISRVISDAASDMFFEVVIYPNVFNLPVFQQPQPDTIQHVVVATVDDYGYYTVVNTRAAIDTNKSTRGLVSKLISTYKSSKGNKPQ